MEENRKKRAQEEELQKKEQLKLKKVQALVDQLKGTREFLYKIGNKAAKGALESFLLSDGKTLKNRKTSRVSESEPTEDGQIPPGGSSQKNKWFQKGGASGLLGDQDQ